MILLDRNNKDTNENNMLDFDIPDDASEVNSKPEIKCSVNNNVRPNMHKGPENNSIRRKPLINITEDSSNVDYNPDIVEDEVVAQMNKADAEKAAKKKTPEQIKKRRIHIAIIVVAIISVIVLLCILKKNSENKELNLKEVNVQDYVSTKEPKYKSVEPTDDTDIVDIVTDGTMNSPAKPNQYIRTDLQVNVRKKGSSQYENIESKYYTGLTGAVIGDDVVKLVDEYNKNGSKTINIDTSSYGSDIKLVAFEVKTIYPDDYPTNTDDGIANEIPDVSISLIGTFVDDKKPEIDYSGSIVVGKSTYEIINETPLVDKPSNTKVKDGYTYRSLIPMPVGANADNYVIRVSINGKDTYYTGINIS